MNKVMLVLLLFVTAYAINAQVPKPEKGKPLTVCETFTKMKAAGESNFIGFTSTDYVDGTSSYNAKHPVPGFDKNVVEVNNLIKMYYATGTRYFKTLEEATAAFNKTKSTLAECFADNGTDAKTTKWTSANKWVSQHKDFLNNIYRMERTLAIFQNTKTLEWAVEYFMIRKT